MKPVSLVSFKTFKEFANPFKSGNSFIVMPLNLLISSTILGILPFKPSIFTALNFSKPFANCSIFGSVILDNSFRLTDTASAFVFNLPKSTVVSCNFLSESIKPVKSVGNFNFPTESAIVVTAFFVETATVCKFLKDFVKLSTGVTSAVTVTLIPISSVPAILFFTFHK